MKYHMSLDVMGALQNWKKRDFKGVFTHEDGRYMTADEARYECLRYLAQGKKLIGPKGCDNFCNEKGCLGHPDLPGDVPSAAHGEKGESK